VDFDVTPPNGIRVAQIDLSCSEGHGLKKEANPLAVRSSKLRQKQDAGKQDVTGRNHEGWLEKKGRSNSFEQPLRLNAERSEALY